MDMQVVVSTPLTNTIPKDKEPHHLKTPGKLTAVGSRLIRYCLECQKSMHSSSGTRLSLPMQ